MRLDRFSIVGSNVDIDAGHLAPGLAGIEHCVGIACLDDVQFVAFSPLRMDLP